MRLSTSGAFALALLSNGCGIKMIIDPRLAARAERHPITIGYRATQSSNELPSRFLEVGPVRAFNIRSTNDRELFRLPLFENEYRSFVSFRVHQQPKTAWSGSCASNINKTNKIILKEKVISARCVLV